MCVCCQALRCRTCCGPVVKTRDVYRCLDCSELMPDVDRVLEAVSQADGLWQQAVKQLNNNQLEGISLVDLLDCICGAITVTHPYFF